MFGSEGKRIRDVRMGPDGLVYLLTDEEAAELWRLVPAK
jgi:glucose/arabinose dehydrogenase